MFTASPFFISVFFSVSPSPPFFPTRTFIHFNDLPPRDGWILASNLLATFLYFWKTSTTFNWCPFLYRTLAGATKNIVWLLQLTDNNVNNAPDCTYLAIYCKWHLEIKITAFSGRIWINQPTIKTFYSPSIYRMYKPCSPLLTDLVELALPSYKVHSELYQKAKP